ncbi:tetratricopeptide repeat-containing response regulator [Echinimonas agarilytica]|uniref:Response regulator n=1 Tax=Echinimonas agarilytica TaxID=1215918 RepID=A0AA41W6I9_9GAMM|nr:tetratricopeptide repeat-containing response regulator [Echinimonas agarilytica]MCM2679775.1 response regulator [Echinimonas agarilytica]
MYELFLNKKALIVDDFSEFRVSLKSMMESFGCTDIDLARNGEEATASYAAKKHDIVLCDYNLGKSQNGQQVLEEISLQGWLRADTVFVLITAETSLSMVMGALEFRPDDYMTKPITKGNLRTRLTRTLEQKSELIEIYQAQNEREFSQVVALCKQKITNGNKYKGICYRIMAEALLQQEKPLQAQKIYQQLVDLRPAQWCLLGLAQSQFMAKQFDQCIATGHIALEDNPNSVEIHDLISQCYTLKKQIPQAREHLSKALAISPLSIKRQRKAAHLATLANDPQARLRALRQVSSLGQHSIQSEADDHALYVDELLEHSKTASGSNRRRLMADAQRQVDIISKKTKRSTREQVQNDVLISRFAHITGDTAKSKHYLERALTSSKELLESQDETSLQMLKRTLVNADCSNELKALEAQQQAAQKAHAEQEHLAANSQENKQGMKCYEAGDFMGAIQSFRIALSQSPSSTAIVLNLIQSMLKQPINSKNKQNVREECLQLLEKLSLLQPTNPRYQRYLTLLDKVRAL